MPTTNYHDPLPTTMTHTKQPRTISAISITSITADLQWLKLSHTKTKAFSLNLCFCYLYLNLELVQVLKLLPLLALQLVLLLQTLYSTAGRVTSVLQGSSSEKEKFSLDWFLSEWWKESQTCSDETGVNRARQMSSLFCTLSFSIGKPLFVKLKIICEIIFWNIFTKTF